MLGVECLRDAARMAQLVVPVLHEADRKRLHAARREPRHGGDDGARVDAAAQEGADRHVADLVPRHGRGQEQTQPVDELLLRRALVGLEREVPVPLDSDRPAGRRHRNPRRLELAHALDDAVRRSRRQKREQVAHAFPVQVPFDFRQLENRLQLRRKHEIAVDLRVVERLDAQTIAREKQLPPPFVPDREGKHAAQIPDGLRAEVLVQMDDRFRIAFGAEHVAAPRQQPPKLPVVVDLAVEHDPDRAVLVRHGLLAVLEIDDAQAPHAEADALAEIDALVVRSAMRHRTAHGADLALEHRAAVPP